MLRSTRTVVILGIAVQIAAFLRTAVIAAALGASPDVDAYNLGLIAPSLMSVVIGSWLQLGFIGRYTSLLSTGETGLAAAYRGRMLVLVFAVALALSGLCFLLPEQIMTLFMPADRPAMTTSAAAALRLSGLILVPIIVSDFIALILNSHGQFLAAALAPLINALVAVLFLLLWTGANLSALLWTLLLGSLAQSLVVLTALFKMQMNFPIETSAAKKEVRATLMLALPLLPAMILSSSTTAIIQFRAAQIGEGMVAIYGYASRLHGALAQVLVIGLSTVLLPHFAALWYHGKKAEITVLFRRLARSTVLIVAYLTVGIYLMGEAATRILFERGAFDASHAHQVGWLWTLLSLSLFPFAFGTFISKFCQAVRGAGSILASGIISFAVTWIVAWSSTSVASISVVTGAVALSFAATCCFWLFWLSRRIPIAPILYDMTIALFRIGLILAPAVAVERWSELQTNGLPDTLGLLIRGSSYTLSALLLLVLTRSHLWFLSRQLAAAPLDGATEG